MKKRTNLFRLHFNVLFILLFTCNSVFSQSDAQLNQTLYKMQMDNCKAVASGSECARLRSICSSLSRLSPESDAWDDLMDQFAEESQKNIMCLSGGFEGSLSDVEIQKQAQAALKKSEEEKRKNEEEQRKIAAEQRKIDDQYKKLNDNNTKDVKDIVNSANEIAISAEQKKLNSKKSKNEGLFDNESADNDGKIDPSVIELKQQAVETKSDNYDQAMARSASSGAKNCSASGQVANLARAGLSPDPSIHSIDGSQKWSYWVVIPGTSLQVRFSKKKVCKEPDFPNTTSIGKNLQYLKEGSDQFFDYGFFQFQNTSEVIVSGTVIFTVKDDKTMHEESWPIFFEGKEVQEESLGNWYGGCELVSVKIKEYCTRVKAK